MEIIQKNSTVNTTVLKNRTIKYIVIHYTAGKTSKRGAARNTAAYFARPQAAASADFIVDDAEAVQFNPDIRNRYCWHSGSKTGKYTTKGGSLWKIANSSNSIGIEICSSSKTGEISMPNADYFYFTDAAVRKAAELTRYLMQQYHIGAENVIRHYDVTGKLCPGICGWNKESGSEEKWTAFKRMLESEGDMTEAEVRKIFKEEIKAYFDNLKQEAKPDWAEHWSGAQEKGITDGKRPMDLAKRCEVIEMLGRLKLL